MAYLARRCQSEHLQVLFYRYSHNVRVANTRYSLRVFVPNTKENLDLYNYGDPTIGTPITLWTTWAGLHQTWKFTQGMPLTDCTLLPRTNEFFHYSLICTLLPS